MSTLLDETSESLVQVLQEFFLTARHGDNSWKHVAHICLIHLCRPGWPGAGLSPVRRLELGQELTKLSRALFYSKDKASLIMFAKAAVQAVAKKLPSKPETKPLARMTAIIHSELLSGRGSVEVATRAAARVFSDEQRQKRQTVDVNLAKNDPLRDVLAIPKSSTARLPKTDLRALMLRCDLTSLLHEATPFASKTMRETLGDELFAKCKPLGFGDRFSKTVLLEVNSSSIAHEMLFRKNEILNRLRRIPSLSKISDIRFKCRVNCHDN